MYVELHCHSGFSFLDGASHPEELALRARELGYPALALTDHNGLYGSMEFAHAAKSMEVQPITGAEITLRAEPEEHTGDRPPLAGSHVTVLVETPAGYANLCRLLSEAHLTGLRTDPSLPLSSLLNRSEGLILLTGCRQSPLLRYLQNGVASAEAFLCTLRRAFGPDRLFVELQDNALKGDAARNRRLARLADGAGLPVVATGNVHYHREDRHRLHDVLVAIRHRTTLDGSHAVRRGNSQFYLASPLEMAHRFQSRPDALALTLRIAERCTRFDITQDMGYTFPDFSGKGEESAIERLTQVCHALLDEQYPPGSSDRSEAEGRLQTELQLVAKHDLSGFFLVYRDILELAREVAVRVRGDAPRSRAGLPPGRGRGSSVSSIICYLFGLSHIDPVKCDLSLGRFLNDAMASVPDIDLDFSRDIREELILAVYERYGHDHVGLVCTFPTYRLRSAVREIGKALDLPMGELEKLAKVASHRSTAELIEEMEGLPGFENRTNLHLWRLLAELIQEIRGLPRHISQHVGGMIISSRPLLEMVPLQPAAMEGRVLCQWDKDSCDDARFIKIDFLALGMLSLVEEVVDIISDRHVQVPDLARIDFEDPIIYDRICDGDTVGLFQVESRAQIQMLRRFLPRNLRELAVQVAIVRPGPIVGGAINPYIRRRELLRENPGAPIRYDHPLLEKALGETLGVIIFQDQVLDVCRTVAGFTDSQAEGLRRAMSRKRSSEAMETYRRQFLEGAIGHGVSEEIAERVFEQVKGFSEFGFPKSHAAAFGLLAYQSAWLRHYYATEYYVALFNNQPMGFYSLDALGRDARRNGIAILPPEINRSGVKCYAEGPDLRIGLGFVRGWGVEIAEAVVEERERRGPYSSLLDFLRRTPANLKRPAIENLIWVGGFEGLGLSRRELLWQVGLWLGPELSGERNGGRSSHQQIEMDLDNPNADLAFPELTRYDSLIAEYRMIRLSTAIHPITLIHDQLPPETVSSDMLMEIASGTYVTVVGIVVARQRPGTAKGFVFVLMEDEAGPINVIVKPDLYEKERYIVRTEPFLTVRGRLQKDGKTLNVIATEVRALSFDTAARASDAAATRSVAPPSAPPKAQKGDVFRYLTALREIRHSAKHFS